MTTEPVVRTAETRDPLRVKGVTGQTVIIGKSGLGLGMSSDPADLLKARRAAHEKAAEVVMEHRKQLVMG
jgi:hypothetical protein|tara:strand:- start:238 stop:447 length:210 start_codon:yes stop_codon:yes gene_type:complete